MPKGAIRSASVAWTPGRTRGKAQAASARTASGTSPGTRWSPGEVPGEGCRKLSSATWRAIRPTAARKALYMTRRSQPARRETSGAVPEPAATSAARRLDAQPLARPQLSSRLRLELLAIEQVAPARAVRSAIGTPRRVLAALGERRIRHRLERLELADDTVASAVRSGTAAVAPDRVLHDAHGELELERLHRRVERVRHRHVHRAGTVGVLACPLPAPECLVVREAIVAEREVVHRPLAERVPEGAQHEVGDARARLDVPRHDGGGRASVQQGPRLRDHADRAVRAGARGDVRIGEHPHREEARAARDGQRAVEIAAVLRGAAAEVQRQLVALERGA